MGITIHYEGSTGDKEKAKKAVAFAGFFAKSLDWEVEPYQKEGIAYMEKFRRRNKEDIEFLTFKSDEILGRYEEKPKGERTIKEGIIINPSSPFDTESLEIAFFRYKGKYRITDFCKTQVFRDEEKPNLVAHQLIITLLLTIKNSWIPNLKIHR